MKISSLAIVGLIALTTVVVGQTPTSKKAPSLIVGSPESVGMSSDRLDRIDAMCTKAVSDMEVPGMVALVARKGKIVYHKAFGSADASVNRNLKKDDVFRIASQSKAITATAVMMLWEQGLFSLDDPISKYIPEFKNPRVLTSFKYADTTYTTRGASREITIRDLLTHTSGIGYGVIDGDARMRMIYAQAGVTDLYSAEAITIEESVKKLAALPLHHDPGEKFTYSEGLDVLGYFIEIMSGKKFDRFLKEHLFDPLGMSDTYFYLPPEKANRLVAIQTKKDNQWVRFPNTFYDVDYPIKGAKTFFSGGAGLSSTAKDYATFLQMYLNNGVLNNTRILSRTTVQFVLDNQIGELMGSDSFYGLAFGGLTDSGQAKGGQGSEGTFRWGGYFNTQYFADPKEELIGVLLKQTQAIGQDDTGWKFGILVGQSVDD